MNLWEAREQIQAAVGAKCPIIQLRRLTAAMLLLLLLLVVTPAYGRSYGNRSYGRSYGQVSAPHIPFEGRYGVWGFRPVTPFMTQGNFFAEHEGDYLNPLSGTIGNINGKRPVPLTVHNPFVK